MAASERTKRLLAAALKALIKQRGYDGITVSDIADAAGVMRRTFYNHFKSKQDLMDWICETEVVDILQTPTRENWRENVYNSLCHMCENRDFYKAVHSKRDPDAYWESRVSISVSAFESMIDHHLNGRTIAPERKRFIIEFFNAGFTDSIFAWVRNGMKEPPEVIVQRLADVVEHGLYYAVDHADPQ